MEGKRGVEREGWRERGGERGVEREGWEERKRKEIKVSEEKLKSDIYKRSVL